MHEGWTIKQAAELDSYHRDIDPSFGAGLCGFVIADQSPLAHEPATLDDIQDGIHDAPPVHGWAATFSSFGKHRLEISALGIRKTGIVYGVFHVPAEAALKMSHLSQNPMSTYPSLFFHTQSSRPLVLPRQFQNLIIQTATKKLSAIRDTGECPTKN
jgi:predicted amino acid-binding ACT domain protein